MRSSFLWAFTAFAAFQVTLGAPAAQAVSKTARCGASFGVTCRGSTFGNCCSEHGYCGSTSAYCGKGCQSGYGACNAASPVSNPPATPKISKNGKCGGDSGAVCLGSAFGDCCSEYGWCGRTNGHCGAKCQSQFGTCSKQPQTTSSIRTQSSVATSSSSSTAPLSTQTLKVSTNARCGNAYGAAPGGMTCLGSKFGNCCSQYSYCGSTKEYCGAKCQPGFGNCNAVPSTTLSTPSPRSSVIASTSESSSALSSSSTLSSLSMSSSSLTTSSISSEALQTTTELSASSETLPATSVSLLSSVESSTQSSTEVSTTSTTSTTDSSTSSSTTTSETMESSSAISTTSTFSTDIQSSTPTPESTTESTTTSATSSFIESSTAVSSTATSSTPSVPTPPAFLKNGGFEATDAASNPWIPNISAGPKVTFDFMTPSSVTTPYSRSQVCSITFSADSSPFGQAQFRQPVTVQPNTLYNLQAYVKTTLYLAGCSLNVFVGPDISGAGGSPVAGRAITQLAAADWQLVTGTYRAPSVITTNQAALHVRVSCPGNLKVARSYYLDEISFEAAV